MTDRKKILVVEDDHFMNESLCIFLGNAGYDTLGVFDGTSALREFDDTAQLVERIEADGPMGAGEIAISDDDDEGLEGVGQRARSVF